KARAEGVKQAEEKRKAEEDEKVAAKKKASVSATRDEQSLRSEREEAKDGRGASAAEIDENLRGVIVERAQCGNPCVPHHRLLNRHEKAVDQPLSRTSSL
uniref:Twitchin n=1 Tax=Parascaris univalens TaxID=6257 RepID=A0A915BHW9_PARUN